MHRHYRMSLDIIYFEDLLTIAPLNKNVVTLFAKITTKQTTFFFICFITQHYQPTLAWLKCWVNKCNIAIVDLGL